MTDIWTEQGTATVTVLINGEEVGEVEATKTIGETVKQFAREHGLKRFKVYTDGQSRDSEAANTPLTGVHTLELVAKDAQG